MATIHKLVMTASVEEVEDMVAEVTEMQVVLDEDEPTPVTIATRKMDDFDGADGKIMWLTLDQAKKVRDFLIFTLPK